MGAAAGGVKDEQILAARAQAQVHWDSFCCSGAARDTAVPDLQQASSALLLEVLRKETDYVSSKHRPVKRAKSEAEDGESN